MIKGLFLYQIILSPKVHDIVSIQIIKIQYGIFSKVYRPTIISYSLETWG